jgi:outer membrane protein assembly factor BamB
VIFVNHEGVVTILRAAGEYDVISKAELNEIAFATPAIADGRVYVRTASKLYCFVGR